MLWIFCAEPADIDATGIGQKESVQVPDECCFAAAVRPDNGQMFSLSDLQRNTAKSLNLRRPVFVINIF